MLRSGWYNGRDLHVNITPCIGQRNRDHSPWCLCWSWKSGKGGCEGQLAALLTSPWSFNFVTRFLISNTGGGSYPLRQQSLPSNSTVLRYPTIPTAVKLISSLYFVYQLNNCRGRVHPWPADSYSAGPQLPWLSRMLIPTPYMFPELHQWTLPVQRTPPNSMDWSKAHEWRTTDRPGD